MKADELFAKVSPSVVHIVTDNASGSGFFVSPNTVATNYHVIQDATSVTVILSDNTRLDVKSIISNPQADVALLETTPVSTPALQIRTRTPGPGEKVWAIGNPSYGQHIFNLSITEGLVNGIRWRSSGDGRWFERGKDGKWYNDMGEPVNLRDNDCVCYVQTSAEITHGSSGGPLLLATGEVVGITSLGLFNRQSPGASANFAVSATYIDELLKGQVPKQIIRPHDPNVQESPGVKPSMHRIVLGFVNVLAEAGVKNVKELEKLNDGDYAIVSGAVDKLELSSSNLNISLIHCDIVSVDSLPHPTTEPSSMPATAPAEKSKAPDLTSPSPKQLYDMLLTQFKTYDIYSTNPIRREKDTKAWNAWLKQQMNCINGKRVTWKIRVDSLIDRKPLIGIIRAYMREYNDLLVILKEPITHTIHEPERRGGPGGMLVYPAKDTVVVEKKTPEEEANIRWVSNELTKAGSYLARIRSFPYVLISGTRMAPSPPYKKPDFLPTPRGNRRLRPGPSRGT